jgi:hypothetical protein
MPCSLRPHSAIPLRVFARRSSNYLMSPQLSFIRSRICYPLTPIRNRRFRFLQLTCSKCKSSYIGLPQGSSHSRHDGLNLRGGSSEERYSWSSKTEKQAMEIKFAQSRRTWLVYLAMTEISELYRYPDVEVGQLHQARPAAAISTVPEPCTPHFPCR